VSGDEAAAVAPVESAMASTSRDRMTAPRMRTSRSLRP
jgi:hypothetical protein